MCWYRHILGVDFQVFDQADLLYNFTTNMTFRGDICEGVQVGSQEPEEPELWCPHYYFRDFLDGVLSFMLAVFQ